MKKLLVACGAGAALVGAAGAFALDEETERDAAAAREFREYRLFWLGESFRGKDLTNADRDRDRHGQPQFTFIYGDCTPAPDSGCAPPYQIQNFPACSRNLASYDGPSPERRKPVRRAAVYEFGDDAAFDRIEVYTGRTTLAISAPTFAKARRVVRMLESPNVDVGPDDPLGPPARGAMRGKLRCPGR